MKTAYFAKLQSTCLLCISYEEVPKGLNIIWKEEYFSNGTKEHKENVLMPLTTHGAEFAKLERNGWTLISSDAYAASVITWHWLVLLGLLNSEKK